jgi:Tfp pilus assembly protein PilP
MFARAAMTMLLLVVAAWGQGSPDAAPPVPLRNPFSNPVRAMQAAVPAKPSAKAGAVKPAAAVVSQAAVPAPAPKPAPLVPRKSQRDPFISPVVGESAQPAACTGGGKRCLAIDAIRLQGVVRSDSGFIAVVVNSANHTFFLRENDPLWNGYVVRITNDAVTFRETGKDRLGRPTSREVTKSLSGPAA